MEKSKEYFAKEIYERMFPGYQSKFLETDMKNVMILTGAGQIGMAIARRMGLWNEDYYW